MDRGLRLRDLGSEDFAWSDLRVIVNERKHDSALSRAIDPDSWFWGDPNVYLLAEAASLLSSIRFLTAISARVFDTLPDEYLPVQYGPRKSDDGETVEADDDSAVDDARVERARSVADELRAA